MKSKIIRSVVVGLCAMTLMASVTACGKTADTSTEQETEAVVEETAQAEQTEDSDEGMMDLEEQIKAVQDTLVFMGGLATADDADKVIGVAIFRNNDGSIVYIYEEDGSLDYGMYTTEQASTDDGREYSKIEGSIGTYGYYFNEDLTTGIIVDTTGKVYDAVSLDEDGAREYVRKTLGG